MWLLSTVYHLQCRKSRVIRHREEEHCRMIFFMSFITNHNITMRLFNVCTKYSYVDAKDGKEKHKWLQAATFRITDNGQFFLRRHDQPDMQYYFFEQELPSQSSVNNETETD